MSNPELNAKAEIEKIQCQRKAHGLPVRTAEQANCPRTYCVGKSLEQAKV
jgi:hypothetical protein